MVPALITTYIIYNHQYTIIHQEILLVATYTIARQVNGNTSVGNSSLSVDGRNSSSNESDDRELHFQKEREREREMKERKREKEFLLTIKTNTVFLYLMVNQIKISMCNINRAPHTVKIDWSTGSYSIHPYIDAIIGS